MTNTEAATHVAVLREDTVVPEPENGLRGRRGEEGTDRMEGQVLMPQHG